MTSRRTILLSTGLTGAVAALLVASAALGGSKEPSPPSGLVATVREAVPADVLVSVVWDEKVLRVGVASEPGRWRARLDEVVPGAPIEIVHRERAVSDAASEALVAEVVAAADELGAPLTTAGLDEGSGNVVVGVASLQYEASARLASRFAGRPVRLVEETVDEN